MAVSLRNRTFKLAYSDTLNRAANTFNGGPFNTPVRHLASGYPSLNKSASVISNRAASATSATPLAAAVQSSIFGKSSAAAHVGPLSFLQAGARPTNVSVTADALPLPTYPCEKSAVANVFKQNTAGPKERAFFVNDVGILERQYGRWCKNLPTIRPFYAVKCSPDETLLRVMAGLGAGFDCASGEEMASVLKMGVDPADIIFANPIKNAKDLQYAARMGVKKMTFDNEAELYKIKEHHPNSEVVLRLLPDDSGSRMRFGVKFGCPNVHIEGLLKTAQALGLKVIGTSFHIGSGCFDANMYEKAIKLSREVYDMGMKLGLPKFTLMDIGGGFPGNPNEGERVDGNPSFEEMAAVIRHAQAKYFPAEMGVECIAEPGRYMATAWSTLFCLVQGKREEPMDKDAKDQKRRFLYYINDGVYGSFNNIMFDHAKPEPVPAYRFMVDKVSLDHRLPATPAYVPNLPTTQTVNATIPAMMYASEYRSVQARAYHNQYGRDVECTGTFFGPTCDSIDVVAKDFPIEELFVGDWLGFKWTGAYTNAAASTFNGMPKPTITYCRSTRPSPNAE